MNTLIPCTVTDDDDLVCDDTTLDVDAQWYRAYPETRLSPGEPAGYEVQSARLNLTADLRGIVTDCARIVFDNGRAVEIAVNPDEWQRAEAVDLSDDDDLRRVTEGYLNQQMETEEA